MLFHGSAPQSRLTMFDDIAHCARFGLAGGAGRTIPLVSKRAAWAEATRWMIQLSDRGLAYFPEVVSIKDS